MLNETEKDMKNEVETLNTRFYQFWCSLDRYRDKMSDAAYVFMSEKLLEFYKEEYARIYADYKIQRAREKFEAEEKRGALVPQCWRAWWSLFLLRRKNTAAKLIEDRTEFEAERFFEECKKRLDEERAGDAEESRKGETVCADPRATSGQKSPKTGKTKRGESRGSTIRANDRSEDPTSQSAVKDRGIKTVSEITEKAGKTNENIDSV